MEVTEQLLYELIGQLYVRNVLEARQTADSVRERGRLEADNNRLRTELEGLEGVKEVAGE